MIGPPSQIVMLVEAVDALNHVPLALTIFINGTLTLGAAVIIMIRESEDKFAQLRTPWGRNRVAEMEQRYYARVRALEHGHRGGTRCPVCNSRRPRGR